MRAVARTVVASLGSPARPQQRTKANLRLKRASNYALTRSQATCIANCAAQTLAPRSGARLLATDASQERNLGSVLSDKQEEIVKDEIAFLTTLVETLQSFDAAKDDIEAVRTSIAQLKDLFLLVVIGEFNSGKSTFLNAMLGKKWLQDGVTPTTSQVNILRFGSEHKERQGLRASGSADPDLKEVELPVDWLKQISLVDTPGTNAVIASHQQITEHFVPRSDMVLFVTSCDRAFTESERVFLDRVREFKKKIVVILSKIDLLDSENDLKEVMAWVRDQSAKLLALEGALIFPVSAKKALKAKLATSEIKDPIERRRALVSHPLWAESRFGSLEEYILNQLSVQERNLLKVKNPLGVAEHTVKKYIKELETRSKTIENDMMVIKRISSDLEAYKEEMTRDFKLHQDRVDTILLRMSERATEFLEETISLSHVTDLLKSERIKNEFENKVVGDSVQQIEQSVTALIDWILEKNARQWTQVVEYAQRQVAAAPPEHLVGTVRTQFNYNRSALLTGIGESAKRIVSTFDRHAEARKLSEQIISSLMQTVAANIGAVTLGALISMSLLDVTGLLGVGAFAALGVGILPYRRRQMRIALTAQIETLRRSLHESLEDQFKQELERGISDIKTNIAPYTRFVESEAKQVVVSRQTLQDNLKEIIQLGRRADELFRS